MKPKAPESRQILKYIDPTRPIRCYRNLHNNCISIKQQGIVRCHADRVSLEICRFIISKSGQLRVRKEKKKNVHAYIQGFVFDPTWPDAPEPVDWRTAYYNPYTTDYWKDSESGKPLTSANIVSVEIDGPHCVVRYGSYKCPLESMLRPFA